MAGQYDDTNRGQIWKNEKKSTDKHPDFTGSLNVDGKDYWVSAWKRREGAADRAPALSFSIKAKDGKPQESSRPASAPEGRRASMKDALDDDEIPFEAEFR